MKRHSFLFLILILFNSINSYGQTSDWKWAKSAGGIGYDWGISIAADVNGNTFTTGYFASTFIVFGNDALFCSGGADLFIVKYDSFGNLLWAKSAGGSNDEIGYGITTDAIGNVYLTGSFSSPLVIFGNDTLINAGSRDIFIVKYNSFGNVVWAKSVGGTGDDEGNGIATDSVENVYVTGYFYSPSIYIGTDTLINMGYHNVITIKSDSSGNVIWAKSFGGSSVDEGFGITANTRGDIFVTGNFQSPSIILGVDTLTNTGSYNVFVVKFNSLGNIVWAKSAQGSGGDHGNSAASDKNCNVFVTGTFGSSSIKFGNITLINSGSVDVFIVKYDSIGVVIWAKSQGGVNWEWANHVTTDINGNAYISGWFSSPILDFGNNSLINNGSDDIFIAKYNPSGDVIWARSAGGSGSDEGRSVAIDFAGNIYVTGYFGDSTINFGNLTLTNSYPYGTVSDFFIAKLALYVGINEFVNNDASFIVYPNPTHGSFSLKVPSTTKQVQIFNSLGQNIQIMNIDYDKNLKFSLNESGIYFVQIMTGKQTITKKLIVIN